MEKESLFTQLVYFVVRTVCTHVPCSPPESRESFERPTTCEQMVQMIEVEYKAEVKRFAPEEVRL